MKMKQQRAVWIARRGRRGLRLKQGWKKEDPDGKERGPAQAPANVPSGPGSMSLWPGELRAVGVEAS